MADTVRRGDIACIGAACSLLGMFSVLYGWDSGAIFAGIFIAGILWAVASEAKSAYVTAMVAAAGFLVATAYARYRISIGEVATFARTGQSVLAMKSAEVLSGILPAQEAAFVGALLSGSTKGLPAELKGAMESSGTSYIVGMYGYKVHLLSESSMRIFSRALPKRAALAIAVAATISFVLLAGAPPSAVRAAIMATIAAMAKFSGNRFNPRNALIFTAAALAAFDPVSWKSGGLLLSFLSLAGIYVLGPRINKLLNNDAGSFLAWRSHLAMSIAVNAAILPVVAVLYGSFPLISFASNAIVALPLGLEILLGILAGGACMIVPLAASAVAPLLFMIARAQEMLISWFAAMPFPISSTRFSPAMVAIYYVVLLLILRQ